MVTIIYLGSLALRFLIGPQKVEQENDKGCLVYGMSLSQGLEVKVDAGAGVVLQQDFFGSARPFLPESLELTFTPLTSPLEMIKMIPYGRLVSCSPKMRLL